MTLFIPSLLTLLAVSPDATAADFTAADFTGRIRKIKHRDKKDERDKKDGTSFRTIVQTESGDPTDPGSLEVTVTGLDTGTETTLSASAKKTRVLATATMAGKVRPLEDKYTITATMRSLSDPISPTSWGVVLDRCAADCGWTEEVLDDGTVARARLVVTDLGDGTEDVRVDLRLVPTGVLAYSLEGVVFEGEDMDGDGVADETVDADLGEGPVYRTRWVTPTWYSFDDAAGQDSAVGVLAVLTNPDGSTDTFVDFAVLDLNGETGLAEATIKERRKGGYKVNLWTQATADVPVGSVFVEVSDSDSDEVLGELDMDAAVETTAILSGVLPTGLFEGEKVAAQVTLYSGDEALLTEPLTLVMAEGLLNATFTDDGALALSKVGLYRTEDGGYELAFSVVGTDAELVTSAVIGVSSRTVIGSADASVELLWQRWTAVLDPDQAPETFGFDAEVRDTEGVGVDGWVFDIQAQFGTGTRSTAGNANNRADLL